MCPGVDLLLRLPLFVTSPFIQLSFTHVDRRRCHVIICLSFITFATFIALRYNLETNPGTPIVLHFPDHLDIERKHDVPLIPDSSPTFVEHFLPPSLGHLIQDPTPSSLGSFTDPFPLRVLPISTYNMVSDELLEKCLQILQDQALDEEEQAEKVEDFLRANTSLAGTPLENAVLDILWRHRNRNLPDASPPVRHTVIRRSSPAPWQMARSSTPLSPHSTLGTSPGSTSWMQSSRGPFSRPPLSSTVSPFTSPRPSPRLALAQPIPHSPNLNAYEFSDQSQISDFYGDLGGDNNVDWLVADDANSTTSSAGGLSTPGALSATAVEFVPDMSPHDILRTVLGDKRSNDEIEAALEANSYDLGATIASLSQDIESEAISKQQDDGRVLVGKSMTMEQVRPVTPLGSSRSPVVCKYWLSTGQCLRADCRFSHDLNTHVCK